MNRLESDVVHAAFAFVQVTDAAAKMRTEARAIRCEYAVEAAGPEDQGEPPCWRAGDTEHGKSDWCPNCRKSHALVEERRKIIKKRQSALATLKRATKKLWEYEEKNGGGWVDEEASTEAEVHVSAMQADDEGL